MNGKHFGLLLCLLALGWLPAVRGGGDTPVWRLEIELANPRGGLSQVLFDDGHEWTTHDSVLRELPPSETLEPVAYEIPAELIKRIRFDPATDDAPVRIGDTRLYAPDGSLVATIAPRFWFPMNEVEALHSDPRGGIRLESRPGAVDPMLLLNWPLHETTFKVRGHTPIGPAGILALAAAVAIALGFSTVIAWRAIDAAPARGAAAIGIGAGLLILGGRMFALLHFSDPVPYWDEWDGEAFYLLIPLQGGFLDWSALFATQAEHRILLTRLIALVQVILQGEWDPRVGMTAGAVFWAATGALVVHVFAARSRLLGVGVALAVVAWAATPFDFNNLFWGAQNQMYALVYGSALCIALAAAQRFTFSTYAAALLAGLMVNFTMGSGVVAAGVALGLCLLRCWREPPLRRRLLGLAAVFAVTTLVGGLLYESSRRHSPDYAADLLAAGNALLSVASYPWLGNPWLALVVWAPLLLQLSTVPFTQRARARDWVAMGIGIWAALHFVAFAHSRPSQMTMGDSKYFTAMSQAVLAAILSSACLWARWRESAENGRLPKAAAIALPLLALSLLLANAAGAALAGWRSIESVRAAQFYSRNYNKTVRNYLRDQDRAWIAARKPGIEAPYWNPPELSLRLDHPALKPVLPAPYRRIIAAREEIPAAAETPAGWITLSCRTMMKLHPLWFAAGLGLLGWGIRRRDPTVPGDGIPTGQPRSDASTSTTSFGS